MLGVAMHMQSVLAHTTHGSGDPMPNCEPMQRYVPLARMRSGLRKALKGHCSANEIDQIISKICGAYATDCVPVCFVFFPAGAMNEKHAALGARGEPSMTSLDGVTMVTYLESLAEKGEFPMGIPGVRLSLGRVP